MKEKEPQFFLFSQEEQELIKNTFYQNADLLRAVKNHIFQLPLSVVDQSLLEVNLINNPAILKVLRKKLLPELEPDNPFASSSDMFLTIPLDNKEMASISIKATIIWKNYLDQQLKMLERLPILTDIKLKDLEMTKGKKDEAIHTNLLARNRIIQGTNLILLTLWGDKPQESQAEREERQKKDSAK